MRHNFLFVALEDGKETQSLYANTFNEAQYLLDKSGVKYNEIINVSEQIDDIESERIIGTK